MSKKSNIEHIIKNLGLSGICSLRRFTAGCAKINSKIGKGGTFFITHRDREKKKAHLSPCSAYS